MCLVVLQELYLVVEVKGGRYNYYLIPIYCTYSQLFYLFYDDLYDDETAVLLMGIVSLKCLDSNKRDKQ